MEIDLNFLAKAGLILFGAAFLYLQLRHRPRATKGIQSSADLRERIQRNNFTLVQLFAPL